MGQRYNYSIPYGMCENIEDRNVNAEDVDITRFIQGKVGYTSIVLKIT